MLRTICTTHYVLIFGKEKVAYSALSARPVFIIFGLLPGSRTLGMNPLALPIVTSSFQNQVL